MGKYSTLTLQVKLRLASLLVLIASIANAQDKTLTELAYDHDGNLDTFAYGADISWLSQQESWGTYYYNRQGKKADLMDILNDDFGINAIRFRVWVNPAGGWSGKNDVIALSKRAHAKGFKIMISFHYSDTWADSQNQTIPAQWTDHSAEALEKNVYDHTKDVLTGLKNAGITPKWVSIGNETKFGMLYETGRTNTTEGVKNFVRFINAGAKAVKEINPDIITIIHLSNGHDQSTAQKMFDNLEKYGANYDCLGFSCYPKWSHLDVTNDANIKTAVSTYLNVFKNLKARFNKPVMVIETGHYGTEPYDGNRFFAEFIKALISDKELGCFYWEPEALDNSGYNLGAWSSATHQGTIAMDAFKGIKHTKVNSYATVRFMTTDDTRIYAPDEDVQFSIYAKTPTTVANLSKIDLYADSKAHSTALPEGINTIYNIDVKDLPVGAHSFYALAYDDQRHYESTDTIHLLKDDVTVFQEGEAGFVGVSAGESALEKKITRYTGSGYVPASTKNSSEILYDAYFPEAGKYNMYLRYNATDKQSLFVYIGQNLTAIGCAASPKNKWSYAQKTVTIPEPGTYRISVKGLTKSYPNIDFIAFGHSANGEAVSCGDATSISKVSDSGDAQSNVVYDLQGIRHNAAEHLKPGIYIKNGIKLIIKQ